MGFFSNERTRAARVWSRLLTTRGTRGTLHLGSLLASVHFSGLPTVSLTEFRRKLTGTASGRDRIVLRADLHGFGSGSTAEMAALASLVAARRPRRLLEFGTCIGCSTWHLWANAPEDALITTIDLPSGAKVEGSTDVELQGVQARPYLPDDPRVRLIEIDSRRLDPTPLGPVDFCFVDAGHSYECVRNDSQKALSVLAPGGLLTWHDATWREDGYAVNDYLKELRAEGRDVRLLEVGPFDYCGLAVLLV